MPTQLAIRLRTSVAHRLPMSVPDAFAIAFSVIKRFPVSESKNIELRAEFFNLFNQVNFANPVGNFHAVPARSIDPNTGQIINPADLGVLKFNF